VSKTLKIIISVAAMIAIPYAAPALASAIGVSGTIGTIAVGAGLGAGVSTATGGDPLIGAITGGFAAGAGPLFGAAKAAGTAGSTSTGLLSGGNAAAATAGTTAGSTFAGGANAASNLGNLAGVGSSLTSAVPSAANLGAGIGGTAASAGGALAGIGSSLPTVAASGGGALSGLGATVGRFASNPVFQSVAPKLVGGLAASGGVANTLTGIQQAELEKARVQNENVYNTKLSESMALLNQARQLDPNYFGQQAAQAAITRGGLQTAESTRGMTGERLAAERRRGRLGTSRAAGSAFQQGYSTGLEGQLKARQAGLATLPQYPTMGTEAAAVGGLSKQAQEAKRKQSEDIAALFGSVISAGKAAPTNVGKD
jgi:hypothetical protein